MHDKVGGWGRRLRRLAVRDDKSKAVASSRVECNLATGPAAVRCASGAFSSELPVGAVDLVAGREPLNAGLVVDSRLRMRSGNCVSNGFARDC